MSETTHIRIGRHSADQVDLKIDNDAVSRIHAEAWYEPALNMVIVKDVGSVNGTTATGDTQRAGDTLRVGPQGGVKVGEVELSYTQLKACIDAKKDQLEREQQKQQQLVNKKRRKSLGLIVLVTLVTIGLAGYLYSSLKTQNEATVAELTRALQQVEEMMRNPPTVEVAVNQTMKGSFAVFSNGTATDTRTGLMWSRCLMGQAWDEATERCNEQPTVFKGDRTQPAAEMANQATYHTHNNWRVPTHTELLTLVRGVDTAVYQSVFPNDPMGFVWSSTEQRANRSHWNVNFADAKIYWDTNEHQRFVRLVRNVN